MLVNGRMTCKQYLFIFVVSINIFIFILCLLDFFMIKLIISFLSTHKPPCSSLMNLCSCVAPW